MAHGYRACANQAPAGLKTSISPSSPFSQPQLSLSALELQLSLSLLALASALASGPTHTLDINEMVAVHA